MSFSTRAPIRLGLAVAVLLVGGLGGWAVAARLDGAVIAPGEVQVPEERQVVQHPEGGVVEAIAVTEGQAVRAGDLLLRLDGTELRAQLAIVDGQRAEVAARIARLEAERDGAADITFPADLRVATRPGTVHALAGQRSLFEARALTLARQQEQLDLRQAQVRDEIAGLRAQHEASLGQIALLDEELADQRALLERGLTQRARVRGVERERARQAGEAAALLAREAEARGRITEFRMQALALTAARREEAITELRDLSHQAGELTEKRHALRQKVARLEMRAPASGRVLGLAVAPRAVLSAGETALYLIPQDGALIVQARVAPASVDQVRPGQAVRLVLPALAARGAADIEGHVLQVSPDTLQERDGSRFYLARIALDAGPQALIPGMPVEAFIRTGARSPMAYLLEPLARSIDRAFRES